MYEVRNHAADSVIGNRLRQMQAADTDPRQVAKALKEEGYEVQADGTGWVVIRGKGEECVYPLGVTAL